MARWYRSGRYYGRNRTYRRSNYYNRSSAYNRSRGQYRAAKQQADNANVVLNIPSRMSCFNKLVNFGSQENPKIKSIGTYALNIYDLLRKSEYYQSYASMYDEFKIDNIKVKLIPTTFNVTQQGNNTYQSITVYTAWDRTGLSSEQMELKTDSTANDADVIGDTTAGNADGLYVTVGDQITTYSSAESRQVQPGSTSTITRWLKPKTIAEKSSWLSTSVINAWNSAWDPTLGRYYGIPITDPDNIEIGKLAVAGTNVFNVTAASWTPMNKENPCFFQESPNLKFKPTLLVGVYPSLTLDDVENQFNNQVGFNLESEIQVSFRGLRKASIVQNDQVNYSQQPNTLLIDKSFILQNQGTHQINNITVIETVATPYGQVDVEIDPALPLQSQQMNTRDLQEEDDPAPSPEDFDYEYIVNAVTHNESGDNVLYRGVDTRFAVEKFKAEHVILTKDGQILDQEELEVILDNLDQFQTYDTDGHYQYYYLSSTEVDDSPENVLRIAEIRENSSTLVDLLLRLGKIIVTHVNESTTVLVGGRVRLEEKGYWLLKRGDKWEFVLNEYAEGEIPELDVVPGDTFFFFGAEINSPIFGQHGFCCAIDSHYNFCFNNEIVFCIPEVIQDGVRWIWNEVKLVWNWISRKIWSFYSENNNLSFVVVEENNRGDSGKTIYYRCPGFTFYPNMEEELNYQKKLKLRKEHEMEMD